MKTRSIRLSLYIPTEEFRRYYTRPGSNVIATADDGRRVVFPASALQRHLLHDGVNGRFRLIFDENYRFVAMEREA